MKTAVNGILLLDKPLGLSSNVALQKTKRLFNAKKAGHTGSLDPLATGMLPLCFGEATKYTRFLLEEKKCYQTTIQLGVSTTTGDAEGEIVEQKAIPPLTKILLDNTLVTFQGEQTQVPPMFSAIKHQGQPLYKLARQGKEIPRKARTITISRLSLERVEQTQEQAFLTLSVECSTGTYIRTLAEDIGAHLGCGAHVVALRREWVWPFTGYSMQSLEALNVQDQTTRGHALIPLEEILPQLLPAITLASKEAESLAKGLKIHTEVTQQSGWIALMTNQGSLLGVGEVVAPNTIAPRRLCSLV